MADLHENSTIIVSQKIEYIVIEVRQQLQPQQQQQQAFPLVPECSIVTIEQFQLKQQQMLQWHHLWLVELPRSALMCLPTR